MARVKIEDLIEHLDHDLKRALEAAVLKTLPNSQFDRQVLFKAFVRQVRRKCNTWETVPDGCIDD